MKKFFCLLIAAITAVSPLAARIAAAETTAGGASPLVISEVQTGGCNPTSTSTCIEDPKMEFIELHNQTADTLQLQNWQIEYLSASGKTNTQLSTLNGSVVADGYILLTHDGYYGQDADATFGVDDNKSTGQLAKTGGSLQIVDDSGIIVDLAGWGSTSIAETGAAKAPDPGETLQRLAADDGRLVDTNDNSQDLTVVSLPTPQGGGFTPADDDGPGTLPPNLTCEGIVINELLPNPLGADTGHEYIELYNPTDESIPLDGCSLQTTANSKTYDLSGITLQPGRHQAFYDSQTGLKLPNAAGGTVWLLSPTEELQSIDYPAGLADGLAWAHFNNAWQVSYAQTPGDANVLVTERPCPDGQYRSTQTNRCRNIMSAAPLVLSASTLSPCKPGQFRNPATNRCKSVTSASSSLSPCQPGQYRNPTTNRCKSIAPASSTLKPCWPGWTRNPETNRCRKGVVKGASIAKVDDVQAPTVSSSPHWLIAGVIILAAAFYAVYEWRQEITLKYIEAKTKLAKLKPGPYPNTKYPKG